MGVHIEPMPAASDDDDAAEAAAGLRANAAPANPQFTREHAPNHHLTANDGFYAHKVGHNKHIRHNQRLTIVLEELVNEIYMREDHAAAAVPMESQGCQSRPAILEPPSLPLHKGRCCHFGERWRQETAP